MSRSSRGVCVFLAATLLSSLSFAVTPDRISGALSSGQTVALRGNIHHSAQPQFDRGPVDPAMPLKFMKLHLAPTPSQIKSLQTLLDQQQDMKSPNYHKWLTPEQWAGRFGLSNGDITKITAWLKTRGFTVEQVARGRNWIDFSGTAAQVQSVFGTELHHFNVNGEKHYANATAPRIPAALNGIVSGISGLNDFRAHPMSAKRSASILPKYYDATFPGQDVLAPGDIATLYDISALITAGYDGTGQKMVIAGQTDVYLADLTEFRTGFTLPALSCTADSNGLITTSCNTSNFQYVLNGPDPGVSGNDITEADLDLEWSAAVARGAQIIFVNSGGTTNGVWDAWYYAVDNNLAPVISLSYGNCEFHDNNVLSSTGTPLADELELMKANSEGISFFNSSGDSAAAECDTPTNSATNNLAIGGLAVSYPSSSPEVTAVGGTAIPLGNFTSQYWGTTNGNNGGSILAPPAGPGYIPEQAWNDDEELATANSLPQIQVQEQYAIVATGGGPSNCAIQTADNGSCASGFPQPSWQTAVVPNQASVRFNPDVSLIGSPNYPGYVFCTPQAYWEGGTSTASTCASGIPAALALSQPSVVGGTSASSPIFAAIVTILNQYLGTSNGLGNINPMLYSLAASSPSAFHPVTSGDNNVFCEPGTPTGSSGDPWPTTLQCPTTGTGVFGFSASNADSTTGYNVVTGLGSVDANNLAVAWKAAATQAGFTLSATTTSLSATAGANTNSTTITIIPINGGPAGTVNFACGRGLPTGATCQFTSNSATSESLVIQTSSSMSPVSNASVIVTGTSGAATNSMVVSLTVTSTNQSYTLTPQNTSYQVGQGSSATVNVTLTPSNGFNSPVTYTCTDTASESQCTGPNGPTTSTAVSFMVTTTAPTAKLQPPMSRGTRIFYAAMLPLLGIMFTAGSRKRSLRGMRMLALIVALGFSTFWMASCGGSTSGSQKNSGTPAGSYTITINGTTGGSNPITAQTTFTLVVQ